MPDVRPAANRWPVFVFSAATETAPSGCFFMIVCSCDVTAARTWTSVGGSESLLSCGPYSVNVGTVLPDLAGGQPRPVASAVDAAGCAIRQIEFVTVRFTATHPSSGDLRLRLRSPAGLVSELADLVYHLSVLMVDADLDWSDVSAELARRSSS